VPHLRHVSRYVARPGEVHAWRARMAVILPVWGIGLAVIFAIGAMKYRPAEGLVLGLVGPLESQLYRSCRKWRTTGRCRAGRHGTGRSHPNGERDKPARARRAQSQLYGQHRKRALPPPPFDIAAPELERAVRDPGAVRPLAPRYDAMLTLGAFLRRGPGYQVLSSRTLRLWNVAGASASADSLPANS
jgi:hypothetical protein